MRRSQIRQVISRRMVKCPQMLGGRPGERLSAHLGLHVSDDKIVRWLKARSRPAITGARVVGIDEWAQRKGLTYGTIVVDLEHRTVMDVLPSHSTATVEQWFASHPQIHTICRDRNGRYAKAAGTSAPAATQVADRFISCRICATPSNGNCPCSACTFESRSRASPNRRPRPHRP
jgi:transposase